MFKIFSGNFLGGNHRDVHSNLLQHGRNIIARTHDVAGLQILGNFHLHNADPLKGGLVVVKSIEVWPSNHAVALVEGLTASGKHGANFCFALLQAARKHFELEVLTLATPMQFNQQLIRFRAPA